MAKKKIFEFPVFYLKLTVILTDNIKKSYEQHYKCKYSFDTDKMVKGLFTRDIGEKSCTIILDRNTISTSVIAHELQHFIQFFGERIYAIDEHELLAYHSGYLMKEIQDFTNACKKLKKNKNKKPNQK